jgi:carboxyl-terminal processing protease
VCRKPVKLVPLPREQAEKYAERILDMCEIVHEVHYLQPDTARLLNLGIRGFHDRLRQPVPEEIARRLGQLKELNKEARKELLADVRQRLGKRPDLAEEKDVRMTMQEMLRQFDQWSTCVRDDSVCIYRPQFAGIGLNVRKNAATNFLEVVTPAWNSPAHKVGLRPDDVITHITRVTDAVGKPFPMPVEESTRDLSLAKCVYRLEGKPDTQVLLTIERAGQRLPRKVEVVRKHVEYDSVLGRRRTDDGSWDYMLDAEKKIGYIRISQFLRYTSRNMEAALERLQKDGAKGLVLDLRGCPGGLLMASQAVASLFLKEGVVVTIQGTNGNSHVMKVEPGKVRFDEPLVVLINKETASGAELLAAALQDHKRAVIAGERSFGKAFVQNIETVGGHYLILTSALFLRPNGKTWMTWQDDEGGIMPDKGFEVRSSRQEREELYEHMRFSEYVPPIRVDFKDVQLQKALEHFRK